MDPQAVFRKTETGRRAMGDRSIELSRLARTALIMFDGVKPCGAIVKVLPGEPTAAAQAVDDLLRLGCLELIGGATLAGTVDTPTPSGAAASAVTSAAAAPVDLAAVRKDAVKRLAQMLGPFADDACLAIERSKDAQSLRAALESAARSVQNLKSRSAAEDFLAQTRDLVA
jgi:hypothetical protein